MGIFKGNNQGRNDHSEASAVVERLNAATYLKMAIDFQN